MPAIPCLLTGDPALRTRNYMDHFESNGFFRPICYFEPESDTLVNCNGRALYVKQDRPRVKGAQFRAARAILNLSAQELAEETKLSRGTVQRAELESANVTASNTARMVEVLEKLGVIFIPADGEGPGVRLRKSRKK